MIDCEAEPKIIIPVFAGFAGKFDNVPCTVIVCITALILLIRIPIILFLAMIFFNK